MNMRVLADRTEETLRALRRLTKQDVLVGVPSNRTERKTAQDPVNNAEIGYWMEFGAPAANIPARPHLIPGIEQARPGILDQLRKAAEAGVNGNAAEAERRMKAAGLLAQNSIRRLISNGIGPALSERTLLARAARGRKGASQELANRAAGQAPSLDLAKPLVDTGQYRNSITYVIRQK